MCVLLMSLGDSASPHARKPTDESVGYFLSPSRAGRRALLAPRNSVLSSQFSVLSPQSSALSTQHSALRTSDSTLALTKPAARALYAAFHELQRPAPALGAFELVLIQQLVHAALGLRPGPRVGVIPAGG